LKVTAHFTPYLRGRKGQLCLGLILATSVMLMRLLTPWPLKLVIDNVILGRSLPSMLSFDWLQTDSNPLVLLYVLVAAILAIAFGRGLFYYHQKIVMSRLGINIVADLRRDLYTHIQYLSLSFHDRRRTGDLIVRLTSDIRIVRQAFVSLPLQLVESVLLVSGMAVVMLFMDWQLTLLAFALVPVLAIMVRHYHRPMKQAVRKQRKREGQLASTASETLGAIRVVQGFRRERDEIKRFSGANKSSQRSEIKTARFAAKLKWAIEFSIAVVTAIVVATVTHRVLAESLSPGDLIVFIAYLRAYVGPFRRISGATLRVARATSGGERILEILDTEPTVDDWPGAVDAVSLRGGVKFEGVSFDYGERGPVLSDFDLDIKAGECVALIGPIGAGKSTVASLIPRFYDPKRGRVCLDGQDIRDYTISSLREQIGLVFQEPLLFATTISENIAYGKPNATTEDVVEAAKRIGLDYHISRFRDGYDTAVGERGGGLSGGQRQCVTIARAIIRNAPIVILDEPTHGLDENSAAVVLNALRHLKEGRTVIMISHDLNVIKFADRVIVIRDGRVENEGPYSPDLVREGLLRTAQHRQSG
jgi:ATP-binding cassette subfamily B protein